MFLPFFECQSKPPLGLALALVIVGNSLSTLALPQPSLTTSALHQPVLLRSPTADRTGPEASAPGDSRKSLTASPAVDDVTQTRAKEAYGKLPLSFEANLGQ